MIVTKLKGSSLVCYGTIALTALVFYFIFIHAKLFGEVDGHLNYGTIIRQNFAEYGTLHFWTHLVSGGLPLAAYPETPFIEIANLLYILIPNVVIALGISLLAYMLIAGIGMFLLVFELERNKGAALVASLAYMFTGNMAYSLFVIPFFYPSAMLPLIFFFILKAIRSKLAADIVLFSLFAALAWAVQLLSGGFLIFMWSALGIAAFVLFFFILHITQQPKKDVIIKFAILGFVLVVFTFFFSAAKLLPSSEVKEFSQRTARVPSYGDFVWEHTQITADKLAHLILFQGGSRVYMGPILLLLFFGSLLRLRQPHTLFFWILAVTVLALEVGGPLTKAMYSVPILNETRQVYNVLALFSLATAVLAASGLAALLRFFKLRREAHLPVVVLLVLALCANVFFAFGQNFSYTPLEKYKEELNQNSVLNFVASDKGVFRIHHPAENFVSASISRYTVPLGLQTSEWTTSNLWFPSYVVFNQIGGTFLNQTAKLWGIQNVKYVTSPVRIDEQRVPGLKLVQTFQPCQICEQQLTHLYKNERFLPRAYFVNSSALVVDNDIMWVTYDLMLQDYFDPSRVLLEINNEKLSEITAQQLTDYTAIIVVDGKLSSNAEATLKEYENKNRTIVRDVLTQEWAKFKTQQGGDVKKFLEKQGSLTRDLSSLFSTLPENTVHELPVSLEPAKITVKIENASHPRFLVLSDRFSQFKDWKATIDGKTLEIRNANVVASYIRIPDGETGLLVLRYKPKKLLIGLFLTIAALVFTIVFILYVKILRKDSQITPAKTTVVSVRTMYESLR